MPIEITVRTVLKIIALIALIALLMRLWPLLLVLYLAVLIAVTLEPLVVRVERRVSRKVTLVAVAMFMFVAAAAFVVLIGSPLVDELGQLIEKIPSYGKNLLA